MSLSYNKNNILGGRFDTQVEKQLRLRREVVSATTPRSDQDIQYLNSNTGWVRVTSSVNTYDKEKNTYTSEAAKTYQLFGGTLKASSGFKPGEEGSSYDLSDEYGYIPSPGITSLQVKSQGTYGTLKSATFNFTVHSPEDFSRLEQLYLRPGFSILIEWGHSVFLDNADGSLETIVRPISVDTFTKKMTTKSIEKKILELKGADSNKSGHSFNYDAMFGYIKNFSWNYNGINYECQVDVISKGEVIESIKSTMAPLYSFDKNKANTDKEKTSSIFASELECFLYSLKYAPVDRPISTLITNTINTEIGTESTINFLKEYNPELTEKLLKKYNSLGKKFQIIENDIGPKFSDLTSFPKFITLRTFLILINEASLLYEAGKPSAQFYVGEGSKVTKFVTFFEHIGIDPEICILPKSANKDNSEYFFDVSSQANIGIDETDDILNIFISVDYILSRFKARKEKLDKDNTIYDIVLTDILIPIEKNLGSINEFDIHQEFDNSTLYIVDRKLVPSKNDIKTYIDLVGLKSELRSLNITSKLTNDLTSTIAIAAQNSYSPSSGNDLFNIQQWNKGLRDRHLFPKTIGENNKVVDEEQEKLTKQNTERKYKQYISFFNYKQEIYGPIYADTSDMQDIHRQLMNEKLRETTKAKRTNPPGLIPFELAFTMKGIAGIKIGQAFSIPDFFLPERYKGSVAFLVTGIDHSVDNSGWYTSIKSQMIFV